MPASSDEAQRLNDQANRAYWSSDETVDEIVARLGVSRNALYGAVRPIPAGESCDVCGERLVFTNRTNRNAGLGTCKGCGNEQEVSGEGPADSHPADSHPADEPGQEPGLGREAGRPQREWGDWASDLAAVPRERAVLIGGAAALGAVIGAAAVYLIRER